MSARNAKAPVISGAEPGKSILKLGLIGMLICHSVAQQDIQQPMIAHKDVVDPDVYETFELLQCGCDTAVNSGHRRSVAEKPNDIVTMRLCIVPLYRIASGRVKAAKPGRCAKLVQGV